MLALKRWAAALAALGLLLLGPTTAQAKWLRAESPRFIVYSDGDEFTAREYANKLEDFDTILRAFFGLKPDGVPAQKLEIYLVRRRESMKRVWPDISERTVGFYSSSTNGIFAIAHYEKGDDESDDTLLHEYSHHFMLQNLRGMYPGWLVEGFAEYYMTAKLKASSFIIGGPNSGRAYQLLNERWVPTEDVLTKRPLEVPESQRGGYYAQAWLLTHYMLSDPARRQQLFAYVRELAKGTKSVDAWVATTGEDIATLDRKLQIYKRGNLPATGFTRKPHSAAEVQMITLPASADALLLESLRMKRGLYEYEHKDFVAMVRTAAAKFSGDRFADLTLARAEVQYGDRAKGDIILDRLVAANADDAEALVIKAVGLMRAAEDDTENFRKLAAQAGRLLARANTLAPDDYRTLYAYAQTRRFDPDYPSENTLNVLMLAAELAPQVYGIRVEAARGLILRKRFDEAIEMLTPVANSPHGGGAAEAAKTLLRQIALYRTVPGS
jgi:hypothetical protein